MILKTKDEILSWLEKNDSHYKENMEKNAYEFIDIHDLMNQSLLKELIKKDNLPLDYFEKIKKEGHQYIVNVKGHVDISFHQLKMIPIQFYHVDCNFFCDSNQLTSLKGCPQYVSDNFYCYNNQLMSLKHCPQVIHGTFWCDDNPLKSLGYFPHQIGKWLSFLNNQELLKYKNESTNINIQNMSDDDFLNQTDFSFWQQFHLQEKSKKENTQIFDNLSLDEKNNKHLTKPKIKKM